MPSSSHSSRKPKKHDHSESTLNERIFVCNIAPTTKRSLLEKLFKEFGAIQELSFSPGLGYCFVEFTLIDAANACRASTLEIDGRTLRIDLPTRKKSDAASSTSSSSSSKSGAGTPTGQSPAGPSPISSRRSSNHEPMLPATAGWPALPTPTQRSSKASFADAARPARQPHFGTSPLLSSSSITSSSQDSSAVDSPPSLTPSLKSDSTTSTASIGVGAATSNSMFPVTALFQAVGTDINGYDESPLPIWTSSLALPGGLPTAPTPSTPPQLLSQGRDWVKYQRLPTASVVQQPVGYRPLPNSLKSSALPEDDETVQKQQHTSTGIDVLRIFAGKLSSRVTTAVLTNYLVDFLISEGLTEDPINHLADVFMPLDLSAKPRGFAFITFHSQVAFDAVLNFTPHILDGKEIVIDAAAPRGIKVRTDLPGRPWEVLTPSSIPPSAAKTELQSLTDIVSSALASQTNIETLSQALLGAMRESFGLVPPQSQMPMIDPYQMLQFMHPIPFPPFLPFSPNLSYPLHPIPMPVQEQAPLRSDAPSFSDSSSLSQSFEPIPILMTPVSVDDNSSIFASLRNGEGLVDDGQVDLLLPKSSLNLQSLTPSLESTADLERLLEGIGME